MSSAPTPLRSCRLGLFGGLLLLSGLVGVGTGNFCSSAHGASVIVQNARQCACCATFAAMTPADDRYACPTGGPSSNLCESPPAGQKGPLQACGAPRKSPRTLAETRVLQRLWAGGTRSQSCGMSAIPTLAQESPFRVRRCPCCISSGSFTPLLCWPSVSSKAWSSPSSPRFGAALPRSGGRSPTL